MLMKNLKLTKPIALLLSGLMLVGTFTANVSAAETATTTSGGDKASVISKSIAEVSEILNAKSYTDYISRYADAKKATGTVTVKATDYDAANTTAAVKSDSYGGKSALYTPESGLVQWNVNIPSDGLYAMDINYYPISGKSSNVERAFRIDGVIPFKESRYLSMTKVWVNDFTDVEVSEETGFEQDPDGNDVRPSMMEAPRWETYHVHDSTGYYNYPFEYYLTAGSHTISLESTRESVAIESIVFKPLEATKTYEDVLAEYQAKGYKAVSSDATVKIQAEKPVATSTQTVYPTYDRSSAISEPQDPSKIRLNTIGKTTTWQTVGDWVEYTMTPTESGLYYIIPRFKQSEMADMFASRKLTINGELPFEECGRLRFNYDDEFQVKPLNDGETEFQFYFEAGKEYTLRFEVVLGDMSNLISRMEASLNNLNQIYLKIKQITGATPDTYRDYNFIGLIPEELDLLVAESAELYDLSAELEALTGERGSNCATLNNIARIARLMGIDEDEVARNLSTYKTNIGTLGTWMNTARVQPLEIDYLSVQSVDEKAPKANANFFQAAGFELSQFVASFFTDYNSLGSADDSGSSHISVWVTTGRDQSQIVRQMINDMFTPQTGVSVELKLVAGGTLLPATLAGQGPDVAYMGGSDPVNYAIRHAVQKLNDFDTFDEVKARFNDQALVPFTLYGETFAIPETESFYMMFYRQDIFSELGIEIPTTWDDLKHILPVLQSKYMDVAVPSQLAGFTLLYYQRDGELYADDGMRINLDSNLALDTFKEICDLFTQYKLPLSYDFANRFRSGEIPLGIVDYTAYTQLNAFATEIRGLWTMTTLPGYEMDDGKGGTYINNTSPTSMSGVVMLHDAKDPEAAWKYIDWITSTEAQTRYGNEYTALLGNSTVHATANIEAMSNMNWSTSELETLLAQFKNLKATPEYPGSYIITRYVDFAFLDAYNNSADPVEAMLSQYIFINKEITRKRQEFGLDTLELGETLADREAAASGETVSE